MDKLQEFLNKIKRQGDIVICAHANILEFTRPVSGIYIRIVEVGENRHDMFVVKGGGEKPKSKYNRHEIDHTWLSINIGTVRDRLEKALKP